MWYQSKPILSASSIVLLACVAGVVLINHTSASNQTSTAQTAVQTRANGKVRNLSLQPEAFKLSRQLGNRFMPSRQNSSTILGMLTTGSVQESVSILRRQTSTGEEVGIAMVGASATLAWSDVEGLRASGSSLSEANQVLAERLVLDSPDQFVLAQLRGASYYTIARNVRADEGSSDNYNGPLWDLVRVDEPQTDSTRRPLSNWRLYYLNVQTGLIDKIVSEFKGEKVEASLLEWVDQAGEKIPSHIVWKHGNETLQEFRVTSFVTQPQQ